MQLVSVLLVLVLRIQEVFLVILIYLTTKPIFNIEV